MMDLQDLDDVGTKQTLVVQDQGVIKDDKKHKIFSPEDLQAIIRFVNKNSKTFRSTESKHSQISKSLSKSKSKEVTENKLGESGGGG